jgi:hypothetical protein
MLHVRVGRNVAEQRDRLCFLGGQIHGRGIHDPIY